MAERITLDLVLNGDQVTGTATKAAAALKKVDTTLKEGKSSAVTFRKELDGVNHQISKMKFDPKGFQELQRMRKEAAELKKELMGVHETFLSGLFKWATPYGGGRVASAALGEIVAESIMGAFEKGADLIVEGVKFLFESVSEALGTAGKEEVRMLSLRSMLGDKEAGEMREEADRLAKLLGVTGDRIVSEQVTLLRAGLRGQALTQGIALAHDIAVLQGNTKQGGPEAAAEAIARIYEKGGITRKQLTSMGVGVDKEVYANLAKTLKVSASTAEKLAAQGDKLDPQLLANAITDAVKKLTHTGLAGTTGEKYEGTYESRLERFKKLPEEFFNKLEKSQGFHDFSDRIEAALKSLDPESENGKKIFGTLLKAFDRLGTTIKNTFTSENLDKFAIKIEHVVDLLGRLTNSIAKIGNFLGEYDKSFNSKTGESGSLLTAAYKLASERNEEEKYEAHRKRVEYDHIQADKAARALAAGSTTVNQTNNINANAYGVEDPVSGVSRMVDDAASSLGVADQSSASTGMSH